MSDPGRRIPKITVEVEVSLTDGRRQRGLVYINATQRVIDLMNEPEPFFVFRTEGDDQVLLLNKAAVVAIEPMDQRG